jgi:hypothetical protein
MKVPGLTDSVVDFGSCGRRTLGMDSPDNGGGRSHPRTDQRQSACNRHELVALHTAAQGRNAESAHHPVEHSTVAAPVSATCSAEPPLTSTVVLARCTVLGATSGIRTVF